MEQTCALKGDTAALNLFIHKCHYFVYHSPYNLFMSSLACETLQKASISIVLLDLQLIKEGETKNKDYNFQFSGW